VVILESVSLPSTSRRPARARSWLLLGFGLALLATLTTAFDRDLAPARAAPPSVTPSFSFTPSSPFTKEPVNFTSTSVATRAILTEEWDLDGDGQFDDASGSSASRHFDAPGNHTVRLRVAIEGGVIGTTSRTVTVRDRPPLASFTHAPEFPQTGESVIFRSTSTDPDDSIKSHAWDLDNDGQFDDGTQATAQRSFKAAGTYTVRLEVTDSHGVSGTASRSVVVGNRPPSASFAYVPASPSPGQAITFFSTSSDPDGPLAAHAWDLDGDGQFDDGVGPSAARAFPSPGNYTVGLRVTDDQGLSASAFGTIVVGSRPAAVTVGGLRLLTPFPIVRISGTITSEGARLRRLSITAPKGSSILVRCRGRSCPVRRYSRKAAATADRRPGARSSRVVRVRRLEGRFLRTGTRLEVLVRKAEMIGKYTRFRIRSGKAPARLDRCLLSTGRRPVRCPS
jgi:PKD repeat protein